MDRKVVLLLPLILSLAFHTSIPCQTLGNQAISIDSAITVTGGMLSRGMVEQAEIRIDSLMNLIYGSEKSMNLLIQLKFRSLQGRMLLQGSRLEEWTHLYGWCKSEEMNCKTEDEFNLLVRLYNNAGIAFKRMGRLQESEEAFLKSCETLRKLKDPDYAIYGSVYANAGNSLKQMGEYDRAIEYLENSIQFFDQHVEMAKTPNASSRIADPKSKALDNLGLVFQSLGNHTKAIEVFRTCIDLKLKYYPAGLANVYGNLVISLIEMKEYGAAMSAIGQILDPYLNGMARDRNWALARLNQIDIAHRINANDNPFFRDLGQLINIIRTEIPYALDIIPVANQLAATSLINSARYEAALNYLAEALSSISIADQKFSPMDIPNDIQTFNINKLIELMDLNSKTFYVWGIQTRDINKYKMAEERYSFTLKLIDSLRNSLELQSSKLQVSKMQQTAYHQMIELQYKIFKLTGDSSYIGRIFTAMELSKSAGLWSSVRNMEVKNRQIPAEELEVENNIRIKIADIQGQIIEASAGQAFDPKRIRELQQENLVYNQKIDSLKQVFRQKYPDYYQAKFDQSTLSLEQVRQLITPDQILIEYAIAFDQLYTLTISQSGMTISQVPVTRESHDDIAFILEFMKGHVESLTGSARTRYCDAAGGLHQLLLGSLDSLTGYRELIIIPEGALSYIPFEALLDQPVKGPRQDYRKLPYLVRNHSISYGLTATVYFYEPQRLSKPTRRILAVAPGYDFSDSNISDYVRNAASGLPELQGTYEESRKIRKMIGGRLLLKDKATEEKFKSIGPRYSILHLAMHSISDDNNSLNSSLVFTPGSDLREDGVLFGHEVYNLSLNAWLTVLSACETGSGQMAGGEGILSFGRAFIVAGCPNLIMTMWTVDDHSSQEIMVRFYQSLLTGAGIADALQQSKLEYLENVDQLHAHPHYWAGFIELGQNQVLKISPKRTGLVFLLLFFAATVMGIIIIQKKK